MQLNFLDGAFSVLKVDELAPEMLRKPFVFAACTEDECSLVCRTQDKPDRHIACEDGWAAFRAAGTLDFSLVGVLAGITCALAEARVGVFVVSTYDTDYVLIKAERHRDARRALESAGYTVS